MIETVVLVVTMVFAVALLFVIPYREVTQPPGKMQVVWETLFPGTHPAWGVLGGLVLVAWCYILIIDLDMIFVGPSPYIITAIATPNVHSAYGVPGDPMEVYRLINPGWVSRDLAPAVLSAVNLVLVFRDKLFRRNA